MDARELIISKRPSRELTQSPAHVVAALLGAEEEGNFRYVYMNSESSNLFLRVKPSFMLRDTEGRYDRRKYVELARRTVMSLFSLFIDEYSFTMRGVRENRLEDFLAAQRS